jgi:hypothetical protein
MILVRDVFRLKFGSAREAVTMWKEGIEIGRRAGMGGPVRLLTDITGPYYTLVFESSYENLGAFEHAARTTMSASEWRKWYQRFVPLAESGYRELFTIVE